MSVLVATDFSEGAETAIKVGASEACDRDTALTILHCVQIPEDESAWTYFVDSPGQVSQRVKSAALESLEETFEKLVDPQQRPRIVNYRVKVEPPEDGIAKTVEDEGIELVVMGATGAGRVENTVFGSTPENVIRVTDVPILIVPKDTSSHRVEHILAPVDFSESSRKSLEMGFETAERSGAMLTVLHVAEPPTEEAFPFELESESTTPEEYRDKTESKLQDFIEGVAHETVEWTPIVYYIEEWSESVPDAIADIIEAEDVDLVTMGVAGTRGVKDWFLGGTTSRILRNKSVPILTTPIVDE
jgi:nucleotide-binding universal stress UspA family protein